MENLSSPPVPWHVRVDRARQAASKAAYWKLMPERSVPFFDPNRFKISEYPSNVLPAGSVAVDLTDGDCTVKGFYDPKTGELHTQEIIRRSKDDTNKLP